MSKNLIMTWAAAMRIASLNVGFATEAVNRRVDGEESAKVYARVASTAIDYAREVREATDGKSMQTIDEMMQG